jgi:CubicO group peptidase (beta-lactamase class C family)
MRIVHEGLAEAGFDPARASAAIAAFAAEAPADGTSRLVILKDGREAWAGADASRAGSCWSITKTLLGTIVGVLHDDRKIALDQPLAEILPELRAAYPEASFRHFLTMTSGYAAIGDVPPVGDYAHGPSRTPYDVDPMPRGRPGARFEYWDSAANLLALAATRVAGRPVESVFADRIASRIGIAVAWGAWLHEGLRVNGGAGNHWGAVQISARDLAAFGELFRKEGDWQGQRVLSEAWCREATGVQVPDRLPVAGTRFNGAGRFGYLWWVQSPSGPAKWPSVRGHVFSASGFNNNDLFVVPHQGLVVARMGYDEDIGHTITDAVYDRLLGGLIGAMGN